MLESPRALGFIASAILLTACWLYYLAKPKPIPGIPYFEKAASRLLGDVPDALAFQARTKEIMQFLQQRCDDLNSPIVQVFMRPFGRPWVVLADSREALDIMSRRGKDFDRSEFFGDIFTSIMPHNQVQMKTTDQWRSNRRLMADTMNTGFLNDSVAPQVHAAWSDLIDAWQQKARLAGNHPFEAEKDVEEAQFDAVFGAAFGSIPGSLKVQTELLSGLGKLDTLSSAKDSPALFPRATQPPSFTMLTTVLESCEIPMQSPLGRWHHKFATRCYPNLRAAIKYKDDFLSRRLDEAWEKFNNPEAPDRDITCATDLIVAREVELAKKEDRLPEHKSQYVCDELFGFLAAGHDTTMTTVNWGLKLLTNGQEAQQKLRQALRNAYPQAAKDGISPSPEEIGQAHIPYLDAVIDEVLRCGCTASGNVRVATHDTEVLGHIIPKGTDVFMLINGAGYSSPSFPLSDKQRSKTSQQMTASKLWSGGWNDETLAAFEPERWLAADEKDELQYDSRAGPMHAFGAGPRSCFGKKLARLMLQTIFTLIVWNFELRPLPEHMADMKAKDMLTHRPQEVWLRLAPVS